ncbi:sarcalumenin isoform X2 [Anoplophora glabripennis]|uniref:sarcalumenin isoform X2 n=1 Tax=Anoplophora glabripennis TaxID=217634 RepID=UPI00087425C7|nr:sarcalumenin isoform X2 [Anoplophora glabripennis]
MEVCRKSSGLLLLLGLSLLATTLQGVQGEAELEGPSESECRPYIEKALKELETGEPADTGSSETGDSKEDLPTVEISDDADRQEGEDDDNDTNEDGKENAEIVSEQENAQESEEAADETKSSEDQGGDASEEQADQPPDGDDTNSEEAADDEPNKESTEDEDSQEDENATESVEAQGVEADSKQENVSDDNVESKEESKEDQTQDDDQGESKEDHVEAESQEEQVADQEGVDGSKEESESKENEADTKEDDDNQADDDSVETTQATDSDSKEDEQGESKDDQDEPSNEATESAENDKSVENGGGEAKSQEDDDNDSKEKDAESTEDSKHDTKEDDTNDDSKEGDTKEDDSKEDNTKEDDTTEDNTKEDDTKEDDTKEDDTKEDDTNEDDIDDNTNEEKSGENDDDEKSGEESESVPEEELSLDIDIPTELRPRDQVEKLLKLDEESSEIESIINRVSEITLKELKKLYENAIKPLEVLYKYRDLSNRHFGDAEIFSKPLILFMGPWSGGKSSIINYLLNNEYNETSLKTEPSPAYFNIMMYGEEPEVVDGTELAADFTFSGLQKFGQGLEERLRGVKLPNKLLEKVNVVEIPGILEVRKQVSRVFPFNDACQWFIDRADIIFLVYDPSKLDVGPETEAILDQLKGREHQTRIILNKADQVKPEELMRVQGALIWNISPLMSSPQPPVMYTTSLWSRPYEPWAPVRLLQAQERAFLRDLRGAIDKRIENKIASARRFAVRVRNHAKMVDCYLTTYYNHKSVFGNKKQVANEIIEHPQDYHIYEGLSTLTNISRYDLPDPDVYKDFFKLNPLYDFQQLSATCTYFRGCPINRLDIAIAYDLPELVGTHKKLVENALAEAQSQSTAAPGS